jgi:hypothetical protein
VALDALALAHYREVREEGLVQQLGDGLLPLGGECGILVHEKLCTAAKYLL